MLQRLMQLTVICLSLFLTSCSSYQDKASLIDINEYTTFEQMSIYYMEYTIDIHGIKGFITGVSRRADSQNRLLKEYIKQAQEPDAYWSTFPVGFNSNAEWEYVQMMVQDNNCKLFSILKMHAMR